MGDDSFECDPKMGQMCVWRWLNVPSDHCFFFLVFDNEMYIVNFVQRTQKVTTACHFLIFLFCTHCFLSDLKGNSLICMMMK